LKIQDLIEGKNRDGSGIMGVYLDKITFSQKKHNSFMEKLTDPIIVEYVTSPVNTPHIFNE